MLTRAPLEELIEKMLDPSEAGHQRRQNTPFPVFLHRKNGALFARAMKKQQLNELLSSVVARLPSARIILAGSQALYGHLSSVPSVVEQLIEADLLLTGESFKAAKRSKRILAWNRHTKEQPTVAHPVGLELLRCHQAGKHGSSALGGEHGWRHVWAWKSMSLAATKLLRPRKRLRLCVEAASPREPRVNILLERFPFIPVPPFSRMPLISGWRKPL